MKTYDEILTGMKEKYRLLTQTNPDDASDLGIRFAVLAGEIFSAQTEIAWLKNQMFPSTATGEYLDLHAASRGLSRKAGTKSSGYILFWKRGMEDNLEIPKGTVCATSGSDPVRFITTQDVVLSNGRAFIQAPAEAILSGSNGNVRGEKITVMVTPIVGIEYITSTSFKGGSDEETDEQLRARIIDSFQNISNGTNKAFYVKSAMEVSGVTAVGVVPRNRGAGTVDVFITNSTGSPSSSLIKEVQDKLDSLREINVDIEVKALNLYKINVYFDFTCKKGYDLTEVKNGCESAVRKYFSMLAAGETMYLSDLGDYIKHVEGVKNYTFNKTIMSNYSVADSSIIVPDNIVITGVQES